MRSGDECIKHQAETVVEKVEETVKPKHRRETAPPACLLEHQIRNKSGDCVCNSKENYRNYRHVFCKI